MSRPTPSELSRRERQVLETLVRIGRASVADVTLALSGTVSYDAVRAALRLLRTRGLVTHAHEGKRYLYRSAAPPRQVRRGALRHLVRTFFDGSPASTMAALLDLGDTDLSDAELDRLATLIDSARRRPRKSR
jgi:predicted transcriptional regulator